MYYVLTLLAEGGNRINTACQQVTEEMAASQATLLRTHHLVEARLQQLEAREQTWAAVQAQVSVYAEKALYKVKLDIGGKIFATTKQRLLAFKHSFFSAMLGSGRWQPRRDRDTLWTARPPCISPRCGILC